ncbi:MAG: hypothetical protein AAF927_06735 [Bacteroidota bacterium]
MKQQIPKYHYSLIACLLAALLSACNKEEPLPVYLDLKAPTVQIAPNESARATVGIKDLWIEHNGSNLGVFRVPRTVPLLPDPTGDLIAVFGGIFENGLSSLRSRYPFWQPKFIELPSTAPLDSIPLSLDFEYFPDSLLVFPIDQSFESGQDRTFEAVSSAENYAPFSRTDEDAFHKSRSAKINLSAERNLFEMISTDFFALPQTGNNDIYIEISYKNNISFTAGLYYATAGLDAGELPIELFYNSNMEWNTVYLHVNDAVREAPRNALFRMYVRANSGSESGVIYLDNIRLVHFR